MSSQPLTIVIKLGSSSILQPVPPHFPQMSTLSSLAETCVNLRALGHRIVIVSSGAIGMGLHRMDLPATTSSAGKSRSMGEKQALAAIGQGRLIALWDQIFGAFKIPIAQILLTRNDIADRSRYLNATTTLSTLLSLGVIPIINENDTISVSEILTLNKFGDNDTLSAIASGMCHADYLFLLTDVDGLYEDNPRKVPTARRVTKVRDIEQVRKLVSTKTLGSSLGTGGMETKLIAAELATAVGCNTVITLGNKPERILEIVNQHQPSSVTRPTTPTSSNSTTTSTSNSSLPGVEFSSSSSSSSDSAPHTLFTRKPTPLTSRRFWILHGLTPRGTVYIDYGAYRAISRSSSNSNNSSEGGSHGNGGRLLAAGVVRVEGSFAAGQAVNVSVVIKDEKGFEVEEKEFGRGLSNYNSSEINKVKGLKSSDIEKVLGYYEAEHVVESVVELSRGGISTTTTTATSTSEGDPTTVVEGLEKLSAGGEKE